VIGEGDANGRVECKHDSKLRVAVLAKIVSLLLGLPGAHRNPNLVVKTLMLRSALRIHFLSYRSEGRRCRPHALIAHV
jgi:hypothetical protein